MNFKVDRCDDHFRTFGLEGAVGGEIVALGENTLSVDDIAQFLRQAVARLLERPNYDVVVYEHGYWITQLRRTGRLIHVYELAEDGSGFVPGFNLTLKYFRAQLATANAMGHSDVSPTSCEDLAAVSVGFLERELPAEGVRYSRIGARGSGWIFTTDRYSGNVRDLRGEHLYHVSYVWPELANYLLLPPGTRLFMSASGVECVFDPEVAKESEA